MYVENLRLKWSCIILNYLLKARGSKRILAARAWLAHDMARTHVSTKVNQNFKEKSHGKIRGNTV